MALQFTWTPTIFCFSMNLDPHEPQGEQPKILVQIKICLSLEQVCHSYQFIQTE